MTTPSGTGRKRQRMERALAALAGSGLDSAQFAVALEPGDLGRVDRSMTVVLAVRSGGLGTVLSNLPSEGVVAWVGDACADPDLDAVSVDELMSGWHVGTVAEMEADPPPDADDVACWLVLAAEAPTVATDVVLLAAIEEAIESGESPSRAAKAVAAHFGVPKRRVYNLVVSLGEGR